MAELKNRLQLISKVESQFGKLNRRQMAEFLRLLGDPPNLKQVPKSFWEKVQKQQEEELAALLLLIFLQSYSGHRSWGPAAEKINQGEARAAAASWAKDRTKLFSGMWQDRTNYHIEVAKKNWAEIKSGPGADDARSLAENIFGADRVSRIASSEVQQAMVSGGETGIEHSGVEVTRYWGHTALRPPHHSNASKKPCPICTPREGLEESKWDGYSPGAHPHCDCFVVYVDAQGFVVGTGAPGLIPAPNKNKAEWKFRPRGSRSVASDVLATGDQGEGGSSIVG